MRISRLACIMLSLTLALAISGCGPKEDATSGNEAPNQTTGETSGESEGTDDVAVEPSEYLTPADVEQVSGMSGIKLVPRDPSVGAGGTLNFATSDGDLVVLLGVFSAEEYGDSKDVAGWYLEAMAGVGDEAYIGPDASIRAEPYALYWRIGDKGFSLGSFFDANGENYLTIDQLKELAAIVLSRV